MNKIKALRDKYGLTQKHVAEKLRYSISQIRRLENSEKNYGNKINQRTLIQLDEWEKDLAQKNM